MTGQSSHASVTTEKASRYLQQLCKHWSHKFPTDFSADMGTISLPLGTVAMRAEPNTLEIDLAGTTEADMDRFRQVVADHLNRFAFREGELIFDWR